MKRILTIAAVLLTMTFATSAFAGAPTDYVKTKAEDVAKILAGKPSKKRTAKFQEVLESTIDFRELASRSLGEHWTVRKPEEQQEFLDLLQKLLRANYEKKLSGNTLGKDYTISYGEEKTRKTRAIVKTSVVYKEESKPVDYKLYQADKAWKIYDIVIDDISLEETYRESYVEIIEEEGWNSLIQRMKDRLKEVESGK